MADTLALIHTVPPLLEVFNRLGAEILPDVRRIHLLDEFVLERVRQRGHLAPEDSERVAQHARAAEEIGANLILVTCSTISPCVDHARKAVRVPIVKIDDAMIAKAVSLGSRLGVVATNHATLEPTRRAIQSQAEQMGRKVDVELVLVDHALAALMSGDGATHDLLVSQAVQRIAPGVDAVVLAQASMARVLEAIPESERPVPILSSPHLALEQVKLALAGHPA
ncbi:MAG: aspartate/glutamate racemase family protein [Sphingomonadaceae bacterium]